MAFDRTRLLIRPLGERVHDFDHSAVMPLEPKRTKDEGLREAARRVVSARRRGSPVIMMMGGHVVRSGVQRYVIDLIERSALTCVATNGSGLIHDYELSLIGATTESVARYIKDGEFGLWRETGEINSIVNSAYAEGGVGMGRAVGRAIEEGDFRWKQTSIAAACYRMGVPFTVHVGIGYDITHEHPNFDGAASGATSYLDFLEFAEHVSGLDGGVVMDFGSSVMAPEVFLKALSMARNVARQEKRDIKRFTTLVCDLLDLPPDIRAEPPKDDPAYYFRPLKTMLVRTVAEGGEGFYVKGRHSYTIPALWTSIVEELGGA